MKFVKFSQAQSFLGLPAGPMPFYREGSAVLVKVELSKEEIKALMKNNNSFYMAIGPVNVNLNPPAPIFFIGQDPFAPASKNGKGS